MNRAKQNKKIMNMKKCQQLEEKEERTKGKQKMGEKMNDKESKDD